MMISDIGDRPVADTYIHSYIHTQIVDNNGLHRTMMSDIGDTPVAEAQYAKVAIPLGSFNSDLSLGSPSSQVCVYVCVYIYIYVFTSSNPCGQF